MSLIAKVRLKNFRGFREEATLDLRQATYLVGVNNAGKTNILHGVKAFFDDSYFKDDSFLNKTEYLRKKEKYNQGEIGITFDLRELTTKTRKASLIKTHGEFLTIVKIVTFTPTSQAISIRWSIGGNEYTPEALPKDIPWLLASIRVTYIHPQEGQNLFNNVQKRLRDRLLQNWGRNVALTHQIQGLERSWSEMREEANRYLSRSLSDSLQGFWPGCRVMIDLPKNVSDLIAVSDINFQGEGSLPEIKLTAQGTGAQSTILYLAQYLLDSDRSLNKGEYHPVWLMEEPESFLHADLLFKIAKQLNSESWMSNIQMLVSTHSPVLLASSRNDSGETVWNVLKGRGTSEVVDPSTATVEDISRVGILMGDANFFAYFVSSQGSSLILTEDTRDCTRKAFASSGILVAEGSGGISEIGRYLDVFAATPGLLKSPAYFIIDADKGKDDKNIKRHLKFSKVIKSDNGFEKSSLEHIPNVFIISLPEGEAAEDMFSEYDNHVRDCVDLIWDSSFHIKQNTPAFLSGVVSKARKNHPANIGEAIELIKNEQDVKDSFWKKVEGSGYRMKKAYISSLKNLLDLN